MQNIAMFLGGLILLSPLLVYEVYGLKGFLKGESEKTRHRTERYRIVIALTKVTQIMMQIMLWSTGLVPCLLFAALMYRVKHPWVRVVRIALYAEYRSKSPASQLERHRVPTGAEK